MSWFRSARQHRSHSLGVTLVILGLVHMPLPQPDFHNIRHHDGAGEVCEHHDHLLRWHPGAGQAADVAVLHWHWFLPLAEGADASSEPSRPAIHAHVADWQASCWEVAPRISADTTARIMTAPESSSDCSLSMLPATTSPAAQRPGGPRVHSFSATFAPSAPLPCLFQRWVC
jgi:hypothetical protein